MNRYASIRVFEPRLSRPPVEFIGKGLEQLQEQYDTNFMYADQLKNKYISALDPDRARANQLQDEYEKQVEAVVQKYSGDYSRASKDLYTLNSKITKDFSPGGEAHAIQSNYDVYQKALAANQELSQKGKITATQMGLWKDNLDRGYKGAVKNPDGTFTYLNPESISHYPDGLDKTLTEIATKAPLRKQSITREVPDGKGNYVKVTEEVEVVDDNQLGFMVETALAQNPEYVSYLSQMARWQGKDPSKAVEDATRDYVKSYKQLYGGVRSSKDAQELSSDPVWLAKYNAGVRFQLQAKEHAFKRAFEKEKQQAEVSAGGTDQISLLTPVNNKYAGFSEVGRSFWTGKWPSTDEAIRSKDSSYDIKLLQSIKQARPGLQDGDYWEIYNNTLQGDNYGKGIYLRQFQTSQAMEEEAQRKVPQMLTGGMDVWVVDNKTGSTRPLTGTELKEAHAKLWDKEKNKPTGTALGKSSTQNGHVGFGTVMQAPSGEIYVLGETDERMRQTSNQAQALFSERGTASIKIGDADVDVQAETYREYDPVNHLMRSKQRFYVLGIDDDGNVGPGKKTLLTKSNGSAWEQNDMEHALYGSEIDKYLPRNKRSAAKETETVYESFNY